jgi:hypothetical protein
MTGLLNINRYIEFKFLIPATYLSLDKRKKNHYGSLASNCGIPVSEKERP